MQTERFGSLARGAKVRVAIDGAARRAEVQIYGDQEQCGRSDGMDLVPFGTMMPFDSPMIQVVNPMIENNGGSVHLVLTSDLDASSLLKGKLAFLEKESPDGGSEPRTVRFLPDAKPLGGSVEFGSRLAAAKFFLAGDRIQWSM